MAYTEADTRAKLIDPRLKSSGWLQKKVSGDNDNPLKTFHSSNSTILESAYVNHSRAKTLF